MPSRAVADAVEARLAASWTATTFIPYDTQQQPPADADAFLVVQYPVANGSQPVLERHFFEDGVLRFVLNVKSGIGLQQGLDWSDTLADLFRRRKFSGVETFAPDPPIIDDNTDDGNWISYAILVPYRYQFDSV
jgi:hypothetical protein